MTTAAAREITRVGGTVYDWKCKKCGVSGNDIFFARKEAEAAASEHNRVCHSTLTVQCEICGRELAGYKDAEGIMLIRKHLMYAAKARAGWCLSRHAAWVPWRRGAGHPARDFSQREHNRGVGR